MNPSSVPISVVIPTYRRGASVLRTVREIIDGECPAEILLVDQTEAHPPDIERDLDDLVPVRRIIQSRPCIPSAMNRGLLESRSEIVLFLDDDATPGQDLLRFHLEEHKDPRVGAVSGRVMQPEGEVPRPRRSALLEDLEFDFGSVERRNVRNVMAGNLSVKRSAAVEIGGFDENFVGVAYRFETDFARRLTAAGYEIRYQPAAVIHHRREPSGGTRAFGDHRRSPSPAHSVGDYYFARRHLNRTVFPRYVLLRLRRNILTRYHLRHPWWIPTKMIGEIRGLIFAIRLYRRGPKLLPPSGS